MAKFIAKNASISHEPWLSASSAAIAAEGKKAAATSAAAAIPRFIVVSCSLRPRSVGGQARARRVRPRACVPSDPVHALPLSTRPRSESAPLPEKHANRTSPPRTSRLPPLRPSGALLRDAPALRGGLRSTSVREPHPRPGLLLSVDRYGRSGSGTAFRARKAGSKRG